MVNIVEDMLAKHSEAEIIEYLYTGMAGINKILDNAVDNQNLMEIGAIAPFITQYTAILKGLKKQNDLREAMKQ